MPAVRAFALYAGMALLLDFLLQITCFIGLLSLDTSRQEVNNPLSNGDHSNCVNITPLHLQNNRLEICCCVQVGKSLDSKVDKGVLYSLFKEIYAPFVLSKPMRVAVMVVFFGWLCVSIAVAPKTEVGLDQELSMPLDSYMLDYFRVYILYCILINNNLVQY